MKLQLSEVTLIIADCVNVERAIRSMEHNRQHAKFRECKLLTSLENKYPYSHPITPINSIQEYSHFCVKELYKYFRTSHVLVAQHDGFIVNPRNWTHQFLKYDYIGAPWPEHWLNHGYSTKYNVGNGGFSLRSKRLQVELAKPEYVVDHNEDVIICQKYRPELEARGFKFAPFDLAKQFSIEWDFGERNTFGQHGRMRF